MSKPIKEALKEGARVVLLAIIPVLLLSLENGNGFDWKLVWVTGGVALLRFIDKALHEMGKEEENVVLSKGLTQF